MRSPGRFERRKGIGKMTGEARKNKLIGKRKHSQILYGLTCFTLLMFFAILSDFALDPFWLGCGFAAVMTPGSIAYMSEYKNSKGGVIGSRNDGG